MKIHNRTYNVSSEFPVVPGESWTVKDGNGRPIERWTVTSVISNRNGKYFNTHIKQLTGWNFDGI